MKIEYSCLKRRSPIFCFASGTCLALMTLAQSVAHARIGKTLDQLFESPRKVVQSIPSDFPKNWKKKPCLEFWNKLRQVDLSIAFDAQRHHRIPDPSACKLPDTLLKNIHDDFSVKCKDYFGSTFPADSSTASACLREAIIYRAHLSVFLLGEKKVSEVSDLALLADALVVHLLRQSSLQGGDLDSQERQIVDRLLTRIIELDRDDSPLLSLLTAWRVALAMLETSEDRKIERWKSARTAYHEAAKRFAGDEQLEELRVVIESNGLRDVEKIKDEALALVDRLPKSSLGPYYLSGYYWKVGKREEALSWMEKAQVREPDSVRVKDTLASLKNPATPSDQKIYTIRVNVEFGKHFGLR